MSNPLGGYPSRVVKKALTVSSGETESESIGIGAFVVVGISTPSALTSTSITFQGSVNSGQTYQDVYDDAGSQVSVTVAADRFITLLPQNFAGLDELKLVCGSAEGDEREITLIVRAID